MTQFNKQYPGSYIKRPRKSLGQNFIVDESIIEEIINGSRIEQDSIVLEIGPGRGALTDKLVDRCKKLVAIELDNNLAKNLQTRYQGNDNVVIINQDILDTDLYQLLIELQAMNPAKVHIIGNLPYYITSPIIFKVLEISSSISSFTLMVQREVADRIMASPGGRDIGYLTHFVQFYAEPVRICEVPRECFYPIPNVDSCVIRLDILNEPRVLVKNSQDLFHLIKASFTNRRKTISNSLCNVLKLHREEIQNALKEAGINSLDRAEMLSLEDFARLYYSIDMARGK